MRGSVTVLMKGRGYGCILGEDGCELYFDENSLEPADFRALSVGDWVEYQEQYWGERVRAVKIRPIPGPMTGAPHRGRSTAGGNPS
jgi:cold shock CspA family protein